MGFDYFPRIECEIQAPRSDFEFVQRAKIRMYALNAVDVINKKPPAEREAMLQKKMRFPVPVKTLLGARSELSFAEVIDTWERIGRKSNPICEKCPLNFDEAPLGCWGSINYPISQAGEKWLIDHFDPSGNSYVLNQIMDDEITGERLDRDRVEPDPHRDGGKFSIFLPPGPAEKIIEGERITSSMIVQYLIDSRPYLLPEAMLALLDDFNAIDMDAETRSKLFSFYMLGEQFSSPAESIPPLLDKIKFTFDMSPSRDRFITQFKFFLKACHVCLRRGCRLSVDG